MPLEASFVSSMDEAQQQALQVMARHTVFVIRARRDAEASASVAAPATALVAASSTTGDTALYCQWLCQLATYES